MKKAAILFSALLLLLPNLFAQNNNDNTDEKGKKEKYEFEKTKTFTKSYDLSNDKVSIDNSFGKVEVKTWSKNEVKVDVSIAASSNVEAVAQRILDGITITSDKKSDEVWFETENNANNKGNNNGKNEKSTMSIDYVVYLPASTTLKLSNQFGATTLPDYTGEVDLTSKFGKLETGNLSKVKSINVEFGKAKLGNVPGGNLTIKFSTASITKISGTVKANIEFSSKIVLNVDNNLSGLDLKTSYSTISVVPQGEVSASYNISTSFGSFKNRTAVKFNSDEDDDNDRGPKFDHDYSGKSGNGNIPVKIKSSFSTIILGEATDADFKDKEKNKSKGRTS
ncbi:MAG: hypothetical protein WDM90_11425 [Ferruginibacter sp.]